jgi:hypothetical protein
VRKGWRKVGRVPMRFYRGASAVGTVLLGLLAVSCSAGQTASHDFARPAGTEAEDVRDVATLLSTSDRVVVGDVVGVEFGPDISELRTAIVKVRDGKSKTVVDVGFALGTRASADSTFKELKAALPNGQSIWALRAVKGYPGVFRPVTQAAIIEPAPNGKAQPAFYRLSAAAVRSGGEPEDADHLSLIRDLDRQDFKVLALEAEK